VPLDATFCEYRQLLWRNIWAKLAKYTVERYFLRAMTFGSAAEFVTELASRGRYHFTTSEVEVALGVSSVAARASLRRLRRRGQIADPFRGFHVIVSPEYRRLGCLPPEQFVPQLMEHLGETYYVALLSAAELHGAAHQRPQAFQVMLAKNRRPISCGEVRVQFVARSDLADTPVVEKNSPRGRMLVASPAATALELVGYAGHCGGLDNVATVLADLSETIEASNLLEAARLCPITWVQRLGYLLDLADRQDLSDTLVDHVREHAPALAPLVRAESMAGMDRAKRWNLAINVSVEADQ
jgi:predicted transcriptional regulator of viral defense system